MTLLLLFALFNLCLPVVSVSGRRLVLPSHPMLLSLRVFTLGAVLGLLLANYSLNIHDWRTWGIICLVLVSSVRSYAKCKPADPPA